MTVTMPKTQEYEIDGITVLVPIVNCPTGFTFLAVKLSPCDSYDGAGAAQNAWRVELLSGDTAEDDWTAYRTLLVTHYEPEAVRMLWAAARVYGVAIWEA